MCLIVAFAAMRADADLALDATATTGGTNNILGDDGGDAGWVFSIGPSPFLVTELGFWHETIAFPSLNQNHLVGIWDVDSQTLVPGATALITNASSVVPSNHPYGQWRFETLAAPVIL